MLGRKRKRAEFDLEQLDDESKRKLRRLEERFQQNGEDDSESEVDLRNRMQEQRELLADEDEMSDEEKDRQLAQKEHIQIQLKFKELGEEKLLKQYSNVHV